MRQFLCIFILAAALTAGCQKKTENPVEVYGTGLMGARAGAQDAAEKANLDALQKAVQAYRASNERFPATLSEAAALIGQPIDLSKYDYDPQTGTVRLK